MQALIWNELIEEEYEKAIAYMEEHCKPSMFKEIYWLEIPENLLTPTQKEHKACQPLVAAFELGELNIKLELLVRTLNSLRCHCTAMASKEQREFLLNFWDKLIETCQLKKKEKGNGY